MTCGSFLFFFSLHGLLLLGRKLCGYLVNYRSIYMCRSRGLYHTNRRNTNDVIHVNDDDDDDEQTVANR